MANIGEGGRRVEVLPSGEPSPARVLERPPAPAYSRIVAVMTDAAQCKAAPNGARVLDEQRFLAVVAVHGELEAGTCGARAENAPIEVVWRGARVRDELVTAVQQRYRSGIVYRDRAAMPARLSLGTLPGFRERRISERGCGLIPVAVTVFPVVVGAVPRTFAIATAPGAARCLRALAESAAITVTGLTVRFPMVTFVVITAVAWMVTAESTTTIGGILYRCLVLLVVGWVGGVWRRAAQPGRVIREARHDATLRRWPSRLRGAR